MVGYSCVELHQGMELHEGWVELHEGLGELLEELGGAA